MCPRMTTHIGKYTKLSCRIRLPRSYFRQCSVRIFGARGSSDRKRHAVIQPAGRPPRCFRQRNRKLQQRRIGTIERATCCPSYAGSLKHSPMRRTSKNGDVMYCADFICSRPKRSPRRHRARRDRPRWRRRARRPSAASRFGGARRRSSRTRESRRRRRCSVQGRRRAR